MCVWEYALKVISHTHNDLDFDRVYTDTLQKFHMQTAFLVTKIEIFLKHLFLCTCKTVCWETTSSTQFAHAHRCFVRCACV